MSKPAFLLAALFAVASLPATAANLSETEIKQAWECVAATAGSIRIYEDEGNAANATAAKDAFFWWKETKLGTLYSQNALVEWVKKIELAPFEGIKARAVDCIRIAKGMTAEQLAAGKKSENALTADEQGVVDEMNLLRADPPGYAQKYLVPLRAYYKGLEYEEPGYRAIHTIEGVAALDEAIADLMRTAPLQPLKTSPVLNQSARDHANDLGPRGGNGHLGADGKTFHDRMKWYGHIGGSSGENIAYFYDKPRQIIASLIIDDNVQDRGHRKNILDRDYHYAGVAIGDHRRFGRLCVIDYATIAAEFHEPALQHAGTLSQAERELVDEINLMRADPPGYAQKYLAPLRDYYDGMSYAEPGRVLTMTIRGVAGLEEAIAALAQSAPLPPLQILEALNKPARAVVEGHSRNGYSTLKYSRWEWSKRLQPHGHWEGWAGESVYYDYSKLPVTARRKVAAMLIDDIYPGLEDRINLLEPSAKLIGVAIGESADYSDITILYFASEFTPE